MSMDAPVSRLRLLACAVGWIVSTGLPWCTYRRNNKHEKLVLDGFLKGNIKWSVTNLSKLCIPPSTFSQHPYSIPVIFLCLYHKFIQLLIDIPLSYLLFLCGTLCLQLPSQLLPLSLIMLLLMCINSVPLHVLLCCPGVPACLTFCLLRPPVLWENGCQLTYHSVIVGVNCQWHQWYVFPAIFI